MLVKVFSQKPAKTPLREQELLMRGGDLPVTQMRRKHLTVHPKVQFSLWLNCVKETSIAPSEYHAAFLSARQIGCGHIEETLLILMF